jgi:hypothetical protein
MFLILKYIPFSAVESEFLIRFQNSADKKADLKITLPNGEIFFLDVCICNSGSRSYQNKDISTLLHEKEVAKTNQYKKVGFNQLSTDFIPFVVDVSGSIGKKGSDFILYLNQFASSSLTNFSSLVFHRLNTALAIGLSKSISVFNNSLINSILPDD